MNVVQILFGFLVCSQASNLSQLFVSGGFITNFFCSNRSFKNVFRISMKSTDHLDVDVWFCGGNERRGQIIIESQTWCMIAAVGFCSRTLYAVNLGILCPEMQHITWIRIIHIVVCRPSNQHCTTVNVQRCWAVSVSGGALSPSASASPRSSSVISEDVHDYHWWDLSWINNRLNNTCHHCM